MQVIMIMQVIMYRRPIGLRLSLSVVVVTIVQLQAHPVQVRETSFADEIPPGISFAVI